MYITIGIIYFLIGCIYSIKSKNRHYAPPFLLVIWWPIILLNEVLEYLGSKYGN